MGFRLIPISAEQITGPLGPGVTLPAGQITSGEFNGGVTMPLENLLPGQLPTGVTTPIGQVTTGQTQHIYRAGTVANQRVVIDGQAAELRIHDSAGVQRMRINGGGEGEINFYSKNTEETAPAHARAFSTGAPPFGRFEIQGPSLNNVNGARLTVDSQDAQLSSADHTGNVHLIAPSGKALCNASNDIQLDAGNDLYLTGTNGVAITANGAGSVQINSPAQIGLNQDTQIAGYFGVDTGFTAFLPRVEIFEQLLVRFQNMTVQDNAQINLDPGSHIHRGGIGGLGFQNGWHNYGNGFQNGGFIEYPDKTGGLTGVIQGGTTASGTVICNLPVGIRPAAHHVFICPAGNGNANAQVRVDNNGDVKIQFPNGVQDWLAISGCRWPMNGF